MDIGEYERVYTVQDNDDIQMTVHTFSGSVLRLAFSYLKSRADAEDIAQEVFLAYAIKKPRCESTPQKKAWLLRVTANRCKNQLKAAKRHATTTLPDSLAALPPEDSALIDSILTLDESTVSPSIFITTRAIPSPRSLA